MVLEYLRSLEFRLAPSGYRDTSKKVLFLWEEYGEVEPSVALATHMTRMEDERNVVQWTLRFSGYQSNAAKKNTGVKDL